GPQPRHPGVHVGLDLVAPARGDFDQLDAAPGGIGLERVERGLDAAFRGGFVEREQRAQLDHGQRLARRQQRGLDDAVDEGLIHAWCVAVDGWWLCRWGAPAVGFGAVGRRWWLV